jgi:tetratricopeptide (TPR) repeat protein
MSGPGRIALAAALWCIAVAPGLAEAQDQPATERRGEAPRLMIVSQPGALDRKADFVDMGFFLGRAVTETKRYLVTLYNPQDAAVQTAVKEGRLSASDAGAYLTEGAARKVAEAIGAVYIVRVTATRSREGIGAVAEMQVRLGGNRWSAVFNTTLVPYKSRSRNSQLLEAIHAHVSALMPRIAAAPPVAPANVASSGSDTKPEAPPTGTAPKPSTPTGQAPPTAAEMLVDRFRRSGDTANLILTLRRAVTERPRDARLRRELVAALRLRGWMEAARDEAARALLLCPGDAGLHRLLGDGLLDMGQAPEALKEYREAIRIEPSNPAHHLALGDALWSQAQTGEAEAAYVAAQTADPKSPAPRLRIARIRAQTQKYAEVTAQMVAARDLIGAGDDAIYAAAYAEVAGILEGAARDLVGRMTVTRRDFLQGARTREEAHKAADACRTAASAIAACFSEAPVPPRYGAAQALYVQAASLLAQSAAAYGSHLETQSENDDKEATLLRQEAVRQLDESARKLSAAK